DISLVCLPGAGISLLPVGRSAPGNRLHDHLPASGHTRSAAGLPGLPVLHLPLHAVGRSGQALQRRSQLAQSAGALLSLRNPAPSQPGRLVCPSAAGMAAETLGPRDLLLRAAGPVLLPGTGAVQAGRLLSSGVFP